ncbi:MAG TPA: GNAT family protein [Blastocatellia bacterium]|nr:GNAT family protein [Blastocatellia bacterium]
MIQTPEQKRMVKKYQRRGVTLVLLFILVMQVPHFLGVDAGRVLSITFILATAGAGMAYAAWVAVKIGRNAFAPGRERPMKIEPVTLEGNSVRLEPLSYNHIPNLWRAGADPEIFRWMPYVIRSEEDMRNLVTTLMRFAEAGTWLPFATVHRPTGEVVGSTSYLNIDTAHRRVEIGATWITPRFQRSAVNTEAKYLMLRHAFEEWGCIRVEFKTDSLNEKSRAALTRIGASEEGIFRNHMIQPDGRLRHSVYFSVIDSEWPDVKARLERMMSNR